MKRQTVITQKKRGPAPTGKGTLIGVRLQPEQLRALDAWIAKQDNSTTRPDGIRRLMDLALRNAKPTVMLGRKATAKASDMAAREIDRLGDRSATDDERASRKRRLLKGPKEFRDIRGDLPKPKGR
jgi:hypothetical protein